MGLTELTVASWNVDGWHTIRDAQLDLLDELGSTLLLLQEVTPASMGRLADRGWRGTTTLDLLPESHTERDGVRPRFACAIAVRARA